MKINFKGYGWKRSWPNLRNDPGYLPGGTKKSHGTRKREYMVFGLVCM
jgi:hypothetical protein